MGRILNLFSGRKKCVIGGDGSGRGAAIGISFDCAFSFAFAFAFEKEVLAFLAIWLISLSIRFSV